MAIINFDIIKNPLNWLIVVLMLIIFGIVVDLICSKFVSSEVVPS